MTLKEDLTLLLNDIPKMSDRSLAENLAMCLGDTTEQELTTKIFNHERITPYMQHHLWRRMVNLICKELRQEAKQELRGYGWNI